MNNTFELIKIEVIAYLKTLGNALRGRAHKEINWLHNHIDDVHSAYNDLLEQSDKPVKKTKKKTSGN
jgi:hypothetical protein